MGEIADGTGHVDMIQDLNDLATLGRENLQPLLAVDVKEEELQRAAQLADELGDLYGLTARDQAYTHLKQAVDEIRECGQYVFFRNPKRREGYFSTCYPPA